LELHPLRTKPVGFIEREPGDYAVRSDGEVVKLAEGGNSQSTHERERVLISREDVAYTLCRSEWLGITKLPAEFARWPDEKRDTEHPHWRKRFEDGYRAFSMRALSTWLPHMRDDQFAHWHIERPHFAAWYRTKHLSAGVDIEEIWPRKQALVLPTPPAIAKAKANCRAWLVEVMRKSPQERTSTQRVLLSEARTKFPGLSERSFLIAFREAAEDAEAYAWLKGGAPKKSLRK
jgi:hypothetical protein